MNRRWFSLGLASALAAPAVVGSGVLMPLRGIRLPMIYGDGIHDDTAGLNALIAGEPVISLSGAAWRDGDRVYMRNGVFRISSLLETFDSFEMTGCWLHG